MFVRYHAKQEISRRTPPQCDDLRDRRSSARELCGRNEEDTKHTKRQGKATLNEGVVDPACDHEDGFNIPQGTLQAAVCLRQCSL